MRITTKHSTLKFSRAHLKKHPGSSGYVRTGIDSMSYAYQHTDPYFGTATLKTVTSVYDWKAGEWQTFIRVEPVKTLKKAA